ncbi:hypothetical protein ABT301_35205 [Streptomyces sp. NPDC000987]|uniref:hypothetical protein n=1 Tax=Streptomyces sp. NPDC000987 TaxID=3154374 RepID=UPI00332682B0
MKDVDEISRGGNPTSKEDDRPECDDEAKQRPQGVRGDAKRDRRSHSSDDPSAEAEKPQVLTLSRRDCWVQAIFVEKLAEPTFRVSLRDGHEHDGHFPQCLGWCSVLPSLSGPKRADHLRSMRLNLALSRGGVSDA